MADIDIQKKEGPPILPIALGVLAVAAIIAAVLWMTGNDEERTAAVPGALTQDTMAEPYAAAPGTDAAPASVQAFRQQCGDAAQFQDAMGRDHERAATCTRQLAQALDDVVRRDTVGGQPLQQRVETLRQHADAITQDPQSAEHAQHVRGAAIEAADIFDRIAATRSAAGANLQQQAQQVRQAAEQIDGGTLLLEQSDRTATFFARAADALDSVSRTGAAR